MNLLKDVCGTFCDGLAMREVPMGFAIRTPFRNSDGDAVALYARRDNDIAGRYRFEDDGATIADLQEEGFSLDNEARSSEFHRLLSEYGCHYDEGEILIHTDYLTEEQLPAYFLKFMALMVRLGDLRMLSRTVVRDTFKADLQEFVEATFEGMATVERDASPIASLSDYVADVVVRGPDATLAIYAGTTEVKALEAFVLWQELERQGLSGIIPMVVFESAKPATIKARTMARLMNSNVSLGSLAGSQWDVGQKMKQQAGLRTLQ